jgi:hypothetical protein
MALTRWAFLYTVPGADPAGTRTVVETGAETTVFVGMPQASDGVEIARALVDEGVQLIELCGGFGPVWTGRIIEATGGAVPVGSVGYGPESVDAVHTLFTD